MYFTMKVNEKVLVCFQRKEGHFESNMRKSKKSLNFDFESGFESGYGLNDT